MRWVDQLKVDEKVNRNRFTIFVLSQLIAAKLAGLYLLDLFLAPFFNNEMVSVSFILNEQILLPIVTG